MVAIGDMVELKSVVDAADVVKDIPLASYVVWQAIQTKMTLISESDPHRWSGYQHVVVHELWPDLDNAIVRQIVVYLQDSKNVLPTGETGSGGQPSYRVSHEFNEKEPKKEEKMQKIAEVASATPATPLLTAKGDPRKKAPASKVRAGGKWENLTPDADGLYRCTTALGEGGCRYATERLNSFLSHQGKMVGRKHVDIEGFEGQCVYCTDFFSDPQRLAEHTTRIHRDKKVHYCRTCWVYYSESQQQHRLNKHVVAPALARIAAQEVQGPEPAGDRSTYATTNTDLWRKPGESKNQFIERVARTAPLPVPVPVRIPVATPEADHPSRPTFQTDSVSPPPHAFEKQEVSDAEKAIFTILEELHILRSENAALQEENARLKETEARYNKIRDTFMVDQG